MKVILVDFMEQPKIILAFYSIFSHLINYKSSIARLLKIAGVTSVSNLTIKNMEKNRTFVPKF